MIEISGTKELMNDLERMGIDIDSKIVEDKLLTVSRKLRDRIKKEAPYDTGRKKGIHLRDAIRASRFGKKNRGAPAVFVAIDTRKKKGAPHAHLIEFGHKARDGSFVPANPFFRRTVDGNQNMILEEIFQWMSKLAGKI